MEPARLEQLITNARRDRITKLSLQSANLTQLPASIGTIAKLVELNLSDNQFTNLPESICECPQK
jgi:Leucine-rich repeat (LRR) protein